METPIIAILVILSVIVVFYAARFLSKTIGFITKIFLIIIVLLAILTVLVYKDLENLKKDISQSDTTFIIRDDTKTYSAIGFKPINTTTFDFDSFKYYNESQIASIDQSLDEGKSLDITSKRIFILSPSILNKTYTLDLGATLDQEDILEIIMSDNAYKTLAGKLGQDSSVGEEYLIKAYGSEEKIKGYLSAALIINYFQEADLKLGSHIKSGEIKAMPETISFKVLRYMPMIG